MESLARVRQANQPRVKFQNASCAFWNFYSQISVTAIQIAEEREAIQRELSGPKIRQWRVVAERAVQTVAEIQIDIAPDGTVRSSRRAAGLQHAAEILHALRMHVIATDITNRIDPRGVAVLVERVPDHQRDSTARLLFRLRARSSVFLIRFLSTQLNFVACDDK